MTNTTATATTTVNVKLANGVSFQMGVEDIPGQFWADAAAFYDVEAQRDEILTAVRSDFVAAWTKIAKALAPRAVPFDKELNFWIRHAAPSALAAQWTAGGRKGAIARICEAVEEDELIRVMTTTAEGWSDWRNFTTDRSLALRGSVSAVRPGLNQAAHFDPATIIAVEADGRGVVYDRR